MHRNHHARSQKGFTILELMIASLVFSTILLLLTYGIIQIGNTYYRGGALVRTQNANRKAIDAISSAIQYGGSDIRPASGVIYDSASATTGQLCIGNRHFRFKANSQVAAADTAWAIVSDDTGTACAASANRGASTELLGEGMRITKLVITNTDNNYKIELSIAFGDSDLLTGDGLCKSGPGSQFCATSSFETTVQRRL